MLKTGNAFWDYRLPRAESTRLLLSHHMSATHDVADADIRAKKAAGEMIVLSTTSWPQPVSVYFDRGFLITKYIAVSKRISKSERQKFAF